MTGRPGIIGLSIFVVLAVVVTGLVYVTLDRGVDGSTDGYSAVFTDVSGLHTGDDVRVAGVRVGRVDEIELVGTQAVVAFRIERDQNLYDDTIASVMYQDIIGQRYLGLSQGTAPDRRPLPAGARIPVQHTNPSFDVSRLLNGFEPLFSTLDPAQVDNLTSALINALQGDTGSLLALITQTSALAESMAGPDEVLGSVIENLNSVVSNLAAQDTNLQLLLRQSRQIIGVLNSRRDELVGAVGSIDGTVGRLAEIVDAVYPDLRDLVQRRPGFAAHLAGPGRERASYLAANLPFLLKGFARITQDGAYANAYACDINVSLFAFLSRLVPAVVRLASPGNIIQHSGMCR